jgi:inositol-pentakisphosphate 2-kinase
LEVQVSKIDIFQQSGIDFAEQLSNLLVPFVASSSVVERLKLLQSALDPLDIEGLEQIVCQRENIDLQNLDDASLQRLGGIVTISEFEAFVSKWGNKVIAGTANLDASLSTRELLIAYLLSATFKDCSMFVRIRKPSGTSSSTPVEIAAYLVDCDIKSMDRMGKWAKLDRAIRESYDRYTTEGGRKEPCQL